MCEKHRKNNDENPFCGEIIKSLLLFGKEVLEKLGNDGKYK